MKGVIMLRESAGSAAPQGSDQAGCPIGAGLGKNRVVFWSKSHVFGVQNSDLKQSFGKALKNASGEKAEGSRLILQSLFCLIVIKLFEIFDKIPNHAFHQINW
jgi:hypothetical protein